MNQILCPCLSQKEYRSCCEPFHKNTSKPQSPEELMRSRYSAFVLNNAEYLVETLHPSKRALNDKIQIQKSIDTTQWLGLKVISATSNKIESGEVEFVAFFEDHGVQQLRERSRFIKDGERWFYLDGDHLPPIKVGRNDPCFCGSGKKYKKCHGKS